MTNDNPKPGDVWTDGKCEFREIAFAYETRVLFFIFGCTEPVDVGIAAWIEWARHAERVWPKPVASEPAAGTVRVRIAVGKEASGSWRYMASGCKKGAIPDEELIRDLNELDYDAVAFVEADVPSLHIPTIIAATVAAAGEKEEQSKQEQP